MPNGGKFFNNIKESYKNEKDTPMSSKADKYLLHCSGIYSMMAWLEKQSNLGTKTNIDKQIIYMSELGARYFALGTSRHRKAKLPFLAMQPNESQWVSLIEWDYIAIQKDSPILYLISKVVQGDNNDYPDMPAFALAIPFDFQEKLDLLAKFTELDGREYFIESTGEVLVNFHQKLFSLPIKRFKADESFMENSGALVTYLDLMRNKEQDLQGTFAAGAPVFQGDWGEGNELTKGLWERMIKKDDKK